MVRATFNGVELVTYGTVGGLNTDYWFYSPLGTVTHGFIYGVGDIWFNLDPEIIQHVVWTPCDCSPACD